MRAERITSDAATAPGSVPLLAEQVYALLRKRIISGEYRPGERLSARQIAAAAQLGATPLREALARLCHSGLIKTLPRRGYFVADLTEASVQNFFVIWRVIGPLIVEQGITRRTPDQLAALEDNFARTIALFDATGELLADWMALGHERFGMFAAASGNPHLIAMHDRFSAENDRLYGFYMRTCRPEASLMGGADHLRRIRNMLAWTRAGDGAAAAAAVRRSIDEICIQILDAVRNLNA